MKNQGVINQVARYQVAKTHHLLSHIKRDYSVYKFMNINIRRIGYATSNFRNFR